jgi:3-hydroxypropanoate dehydrogenase
MHALDHDALNTLFTAARTHHAFLDKPIASETLEKLYDLAKWGPTAFNMSPARFVFVRSHEGKDKLFQALMESNIAQTRQAAVTVIVATDTRFHEHLPRLYPAYDAQPIFANNAALAEVAGFRNSTLQGAYLLMAARALGLDCGPMSGFDPGKLDSLFFPDGRYKSNFLINLGYADPAGTYPRGPRLAFEEAVQIV